MGLVRFQVRDVKRGGGGELKRGCSIAGLEASSVVLSNEVCIDLIHNDLLHNHWRQSPEHHLSAVRWVIHVHACRCHLQPLLAGHESLASRDTTNDRIDANPMTGSRRGGAAAGSGAGGGWWGTWLGFRSGGQGLGISLSLDLLFGEGAVTAVSCA
jgi:hypothetical protein